MITLETSFSYDGFVLTQVKREGKVALFEKTKATHKSPSYEVVVVQVSKAREVFGRAIAEHEIMPSSEEWGTNGWSYSDLDSALKRFDKLVREQERADLGIPMPPDMSEGQKARDEDQLHDHSH